MANDPINKNLGTVTAYGYAKSKGYTGTEEEFAELMADYATVGQQAAESAQEAAASAQGAQAAKDAAEVAASSAQASGSAAASSASAAATAAQAASSSATAASTAQQGAAAAQEAAVSAQGAAEQAATAAGTAKNAAQTAQQSAEDAKVGAVTAQGQAEQAASSAQASAQEAQSYAAAYYALLPTDEASGPVASFTDGAGGIPVKDLTVQIAPVQSGSGDPSPDNVRPISGWTGASLTHTGTNMLGGAALRDAVKASMPSATDFPEEAYILFGAAAQTAQPISAGLRFKDNTQYTFFLSIYKESSTPSNLVVRYTDGTLTDIPGVSAVNQKELIVFTSAAGKTIERFGKRNIGGVTRMYYDECGIFEGVLHPGDFAAYRGATYPISWESEAGTVYGGTLDLTAGLLTARPYYASYAGEALVGPWISSMDVYSPGGTPTSGAKVVDLGGMPSTYQLTPTEVKTLLGVNNIWADTGDSAVSYRADVALYIDKKLGVSG